MKLNAAPLGLAAFALTTFVLSLHNLSLIGKNVAVALAFFMEGSHYGLPFSLWDYLCYLILAWYVSAGELINETYGKKLPL